MSNLLILYPQNFEETRLLGSWINSYATLQPFPVIKPTLWKPQPKSNLPNLEIEFNKYTHIIFVYWRKKHQSIDPVYENIFEILRANCPPDKIAVIEVSTAKEISTQIALNTNKGNDHQIFFSITKKDILHDIYSRVSFMQFIEEFTQHHEFNERT